MRALVLASVLVASSRVAAEPRPVTLQRGEVAARLVIEGNLDKRDPLRPLSLAPDAWIGVTDRLTVGLIHSNQSLDRIDAGSSFCVRQLEGDCDAVYRGGGVDVRWRLRSTAAARVRLLLRDLDPAKPAFTAGALVRWNTGRFEVVTDPYIRVGLANRSQGNRDALMLPVYLGIHVRGGRLAVHTGVDGDLAVWRDGWHVPVALIMEAQPIRALTAGVEIGFTSLLGPQNNVRQSAMLLYAEWRGNAW